MRRRVDLSFGWADADMDLFVLVGDRSIPRLIRVHFEGVGGQPQLEFEIDSTSGVPRCVRLAIEATEGGREVRTSDLRSVELANWVEAIVPLFVGEAESSDGAVRVTMTSDADDPNRIREAVKAIRGARRADRRKFDDDFLRRVAQTYESDPVRPAEAVELAFDVSPRTAYRYIRMARDRGLLRSEGKDD